VVLECLKCIEAATRSAQDAGHAFCRCALNAPMSFFYIFGRNINDLLYYYYYYSLDVSTPLFSFFCVSFIH